MQGLYEDFGDCMTFDTTYKTNIHHMPLGVFVGVNHHLQSTIFACTLVRDESTESFVWLFKTFLKCINSKHPTIILTYQYAPMGKAISIVFYKTLHKLMTSTQRSESMNSSPKRGCVSERKNMHRFAEHVNKFIFTRRQIENQLTMASLNESTTRTFYGFENQLSKLYTKAVFKEFQTKLKRSTLFRIKQNPDHPHVDEYNYLVTFHEPTNDFTRLNHASRVLADSIGGEYS